MHTFSQPPILKGTEKEQLVQLRQYLYRMSLDLTQAMNNLTSENFAPGGLPAVKSQQAVSQPKKPTDNTEETKQALSELKSLIVKTADLVYAEMDRLEASLSSTYVAQSTFGTFSEEINTQLSATAERVEQNIQYQATLEDTFRGVSDAFDQYVIETGGYIKQGIIGYDGAIPIIGIAIGQDIKVTGTDTKDGKEYEVIDTSSNMSVWTPEKLAFYVNGMEAAYVSNGAFYVADMYVLSRLFIENWQISTNRGLTIKWIGG
jgi:hypothetical protein